MRRCFIETEREDEKKEIILWKSQERDLEDRH